VMVEESYPQMTKKYCDFYCAFEIFVVVMVV
jgi:hypothetical protein